MLFIFILDARHSSKLVQYPTPHMNQRHDCWVTQGFELLLSRSLGRSRAVTHSIWGRQKSWQLLYRTSTPLPCQHRPVWDALYHTSLIICTFFICHVLLQAACLYSTSVTRSHSNLHAFHSVLGLQDTGNIQSLMFFMEIYRSIYELHEWIWKKSE